MFQSNTTNLSLVDVAHHFSQFEHPNEKYVRKLPGKLVIKLTLKHYQSFFPHLKSGFHFFN